MIYVTGDCHGDIEKLDPKAFPMQNEMTKDDYVIICGDFGLIWNYENESAYEKRYLDWLNSRSFTTLFVDGNHENFTRLYDYPVEKWHGGLVHKIRDSVLHLMRGEVFLINDKRVFAFGGASSHDVQDGILDMDEEEKIYRLRKQGACFRIKDFSWWDLELPTDKEMQNGVNNLKNVNYKVDYVITHCCPTDIQALINRHYKTDKLTDYLLEINKKLDFQKWFFGHYHINENINEKFTCLYEDITPIENCKKTQQKEEVTIKKYDDDEKVELINFDIDIDTSELPRLLQNTIEELEGYERENDWAMYDGVAEGLEAAAKHFYVSGRISKKQYHLLVKKYRGY